MKTKKKIHFISKQINEILYEEKDYYQKEYEEGQLSVLENEIIKLVNRLNENNQILQQDKIFLKQSLEDISHQIKTPLTSLNLIQERLKTANNQDKRQLIHEQQKLLDQIEWLIYSLLKIAQLDTNTVQFLQEDIDQELWIQDILQSFEIQLDIKNIQVILDIPQGYFYHIDKKWTSEALSNIIKNCIEHLDYEGILSISIHNNPLYDEIIIQDNGKGIDQEDIHHIFERFYKGKKASSQSIGIGLSLAKEIIEKQNGTISVENINKGVQFTIHFYKGIV